MIIDQASKGTKSTGKVPEAATSGAESLNPAAKGFAVEQHVAL